MYALNATFVFPFDILPFVRKSGRIQALPPFSLPFRIRARDSGQEKTSLTSFVRAAESMDERNDDRKKLLNKVIN